jgi:SAM-dependent methyltransferase
LFRKYREAFGDEELRPVAGARSNSFNYAPERDLTWADGEDCPIRPSILPYDRTRHIFVRRDGVMTQFRTHTRDFSDPELHTIKFEHGQVYLDISDKPAPDDFPVDLRKLREVAECADCHQAAACSRCFEVDDTDAFSADDEHVVAVVRELEGDVLDVGCGETLYADVLAPRARAGEVRYTGVEPHAGACQAFRARNDWGQIINAPIEDFELDDTGYDHVLVLRSYNHLADPAKTLRRLAESIRPGGTMLVVDNVAFGLVRTHEQRERAERSDSEFEHFNNDDSEAAIENIPTDLVRLIEHRPVTPDSSNQWLLHYRRVNG